MSSVRARACRRCVAPCASVRALARNAAAAASVAPFRRRARCCLTRAPPPTPASQRTSSASGSSPRTSFNPASTLSTPLQQRLSLVVVHTPATKGGHAGRTIEATPRTDTKSKCAPVVALLSGRATRARVRHALVERTHAPLCHARCTLAGCSGAWALS
jgi:hypothetical protein